MTPPPVRVVIFRLKNISVAAFAQSGARRHAAPMVDVEQLELEQAEREITAACLSLFDPKKVALVRSA